MSNPLLYLYCLETFPETFSTSLLRAIIARNHLPFFICSNFVHSCPNFQYFCLLSEKLYPCPYHLEKDLIPFLLLLFIVGMRTLNGKYLRLAHPVEGWLCIFTTVSVIKIFCFNLSEWLIELYQKLFETYSKNRVLLRNLTFAVGSSWLQASF